MLVMERLFPLDFRAYEVDTRELWMEVFEDELRELHKAGFVHRDLQRNNPAFGMMYDNIFLTEAGIRLINVGISELKMRVGERQFSRFVDMELRELEKFRHFFLNR